MSITYLGVASSPDQSHTVQEFIGLGRNNKDHFGYYDFSYIEKRNDIEYVVKNIIDDYMTELKELSKTIQFADWAITKYRYNPKMLSKDLYNTTRLWHMILRINGMANVHDFSLSDHKVKLIESATLRNFMGKIFSVESFSLQTFSNRHKQDETPHFIERYKPLFNHNAKFLYM